MNERLVESAVKVEPAETKVFIYCSEWRERAMTLCSGGNEDEKKINRISKGKKKGKV
jgi:hypothetical protein